MSQILRDVETHVIANGETITNVKTLVQVCLAPGSAVATCKLEWTNKSGSTPGKSNVRLQAAANGESVVWPGNEYGVAVRGQTITATITGSGAVVTLNVIGVGTGAIAVA